MKKVLSLTLALSMLCCIAPMAVFVAAAGGSVDAIELTEEFEAEDETLFSCVDTDRLCNEIPICPGRLIPEDCTAEESDIYGYVVDYPLKKGHVLTISDKNYVFSVRKQVNGNYTTMLKQATTASFTATEDMMVAMLIRKPDKSVLTADDLADIVLYDSQYGMIGVEGYAKRFSVEAKTVDGGTATTRAAVFLPESYSDSGKPSRLIVMTNGHSAHLTDSVWNKNSAENVQVIQNYLNAGYAVWVVDNTASSTSQTPDLGCPQLVDSYFKAYEYIQNNLNVEKKFSVHARSFGTFAAVRIMREHPELVKCAVMTGSRVSIKAEWPGIKKVHVANRFGFTDTAGTTYEADKLVGYDPYTDVNDTVYALPPTFWMLANGDSTGNPCEFIEKLTAHGNDVTLKIYSDISHTGICTLNTEETFGDALAYLEKHQAEVHTHSYTSAVTAPTCTEQGYTTHTCPCGDSYVDAYVAALGHSFGAWVETAAPACNAEGRDKRICACGYEEYRDTRISGSAERIQVSNPLDASYFAGKTIVCVGDSITNGHGVKKGTEDYVTLLGETLGANMVNRGSNGVVLSTGGSRTCAFSKLDNLPEGTAVVTILLGINDFSAAYSSAEKSYYDLGTFGSDDTTTIYGAAKMWCERIAELQATDGYEDTLFVFATPVICSWNISVTSARDWNQDKANVFGCTLRQYCTAIMEVCAYYGVPVLDLNMYSGMYYHSEEDNNVSYFGGDGVHPGANGHVMIADAFSEFLLENYTCEERIVKDCGHSYEATIAEPTCTEVGYTAYRCPECYYSYEADYIDPAGHDYKSEVTGSTCTEQGYTTHTCTTCGDSYVDNYVDAVGHDCSAGVCAVCGEDTLTTSLDGNVLTLSGELEDGVRIFVAGYDNSGRFSGVKAFTWQGGSLATELPVWEKVKLSFSDENWLPLRQSVTLK